MPVWVQIIIGVAAALTAMGTVWRLFLKPMAELIVLGQKALPLMRDLVRVFGTTPTPFEVLNDIVAQFRTDSGSSLRDVVNHLTELADAGALAAQVAAVATQASENLAERDREQLSRLIRQLDRVTDKVEGGNAAVDRLAMSADVVASDLANRYKRADAIDEGHPGEAADAASRSAKDVT